MIFSEKKQTQQKRARENENKKRIDGLGEESRIERSEGVNPRVITVHRCEGIILSGVETQLTNPKKSSQSLEQSLE